MKWIIAGYAVLVLAACAECGLLVQAADTQERLEREKDAATQQSTIWQARAAEQATTVIRRVDTVRVWLTRYDTLRQTLDVHDTVSVWQFVAAADSSAKACTELANDCAAFRLTADSTIHAMGRERDSYAKLWQAAKPSKWAKAKPYLFGALGLWLGLQLRR